MEIMNKNYTQAKKRPIKIIQFGEGNFLRAFVDYIVDIANEENVFDGSVAIVKPISYGNIDLFTKQECQYTVLLRGLVDDKEYIEKRTITSIDSICDCTVDYDSYLSLARIDTVKYIVSNTTEAGIKCDNDDKFEDKPAKSYPAKLTQLLYERAETFEYDVTKGLIMLPVELIDNNGDELKKCVFETIDKWKLNPNFSKWVEESCVFANTLVDRIVTGYPKNIIETIWNDTGVKDELLVTAEPFALWVIESEKPIQQELPLDIALKDKKGMSVIFTNNHKPYKQRKVRILNGAHTAFCLVSYLSGNNTVLESMKDKEIHEYIENVIYKEIIPTLKIVKNEPKQHAQYNDINCQYIDINAQNIDTYAKDVEQRFSNPYINHALLSISLNSVSKWKTRCLPTFMAYYDTKKELPKNLLFSLAALFCFYTSSKLNDKTLIGSRNGEEYIIIDDYEVLEFFKENSSRRTEDMIRAFFKENDFLGINLLDIEGLEILLISMVNDIKLIGIKNALRKNSLIGC